MPCSPYPGAAQRNRARHQRVVELLGLLALGVVVRIDQIAKVELPSRPGRPGSRGCRWHRLRSPHSSSASGQAADGRRNIGGDDAAASGTLERPRNGGVGAR